MGEYIRSLRKMQSLDATLLAPGDRNTSLFLLIYNLGFPQAFVDYERGARALDRDVVAVHDQDVTSALLTAKRDVGHQQGRRAGVDRNAHADEISRQQRQLRHTVPSL